jgi:hypothetical protein
MAASHAAIVGAGTDTMMSKLLTDVNSSSKRP